MQRPPHSDSGVHLSSCSTNSRIKIGWECCLLRRKSASRGMRISKLCIGTIPNECRPRQFLQHFFLCVTWKPYIFISDPAIRCSLDSGSWVSNQERALAQGGRFRWTRSRGHVGFTIDKPSPLQVLPSSRFVLDCPAVAPQSYTENYDATWTSHFSILSPPPSLSRCTRVQMRSLTPFRVWKDVNYEVS